MSKHVINSIRFDLPSNSFEEAGRQRSEARRWASAGFPAMLEKILDEFASENEFLLINRLELNIHQMPWDMQDWEWIGILKQKLKDSLMERSVYNQLFHQWIHYLQTGTHLRHAFIKVSREYNDTLIKQRNELQKIPISAIKNIRPGISFFKRLFSEFQKSLVLDFLAWLFELNQVKAMLLYTRLQEMIRSDQGYLENLLQRHFSTSSLAEPKSRKDFQEELSAPGEKLSLPLGTNFKQIFPEDSSLECDNAGLVLLLPYYERLFAACGFLDHNGFVSNKAGELGVQALHYLATNESLAEDGMYLLPKLICGLDPQIYIDGIDPLPAYIIQECTDLLLAVTSHWDALKNSSVKALQEGFLQRSGRIMITRGQINIHVEESGIDILLNNIPWGFRYYKLPWNDMIIQTEWY